jgi:hypothetical protein
MLGVLSVAMTKRVRSITLPHLGAARSAVFTSDAHEPENTSGHAAKKTRRDTQFLPRKIATAENAAKADNYTPFAKLHDIMARMKANPVKGDAVVYWMRMQDLRSKS